MKSKGDAFGTRWLPWEDAALIKAWTVDGLSAEEARRTLFPNRTRNSVCGRLDRLGLLTKQSGVRHPRKRWESERAKANRQRRQAEMNAILSEARKIGARVVTRVGRRAGIDDAEAREEALTSEREFISREFKGYDPARDPKPDWLKFSFQREQRKAA